MANDISWKDECRLYEALFFSVTGHRTTIRTISPVEGELGYTVKNRDIYLAYEHPLMDILPPKERRAFRMGVFAHEMSHQLFTDFGALEDTLKKCGWSGMRYVVALLNNIVEDPAIEYQAPSEYGGELLQALRFSILHIYRMAPPLEVSPNAFSQLCNALIQFGDIGFLKGRFTFPEARDAFLKIAPDFNDAVIDPDAKARPEYALRWAQLTRPLWEQDTYAEEESFNESLEGTRKANGIGNSSGERGEKDNPRKDRADTDAGRRRHDWLEENRPSQTGTGTESAKDGEDADTSSSETSNSSSQNESNDDSGSKTDTEKENGSDGKKDGDGKRKDTDKDSEKRKEKKAQAGGAGNSKKTEEEDREDTEDSSEKEKKDKEKKNDDESDNDEHDNRSTTLPSWKSIVDKEIKKIDKDFIDEIEKQIERTKKREARAMAYDSLDMGEVPDVETDVTCLNQIMQVTAENLPPLKRMYMEIRNKHVRDIRILVSSLRDILRQDMPEVYRAHDGKYNVKRAATQATVSVFDKRRSERKLGDLAVMLLIDESGSMFGEKEEMAKTSAIILTEAFSMLNIPFAVMGYCGDLDGYDAIHHHYVIWKGSAAQKYTLALLQSDYGGNYDGYSIRNASFILNKRQEEHKILFIVSDGYPSSSRYGGFKTGLDDTSKAIRMAKLSADVFGIGIGDCKVSVMERMYGGSFIQVKPENLSMAMTKELKTILRKQIH